MGVKHLWSILEPACQQVSYEDLAGKTVAVDLSIWIIECRSVSNNHHKSVYLEYDRMLMSILDLTFFSLEHYFPVY